MSNKPYEYVQGRWCPDCKEFMDIEQSRRKCWKCGRPFTYDPVSVRDAVEGEEEEYE